MLASSNIGAQEGHMVLGTGAESIAGFNLKVVQETIALLRQETYYPQSMRRTPANPPLCDRLVQEVVRMLLQAIYEPIFKDNSHGFRPNRSCHTALVQVKTRCKDTNWVIEGDITDFYANVQSGKLRELLARNISDGRFLSLIDKFLKAGYMDGNLLAISLAGASQGSSVGSMLANIYLHELDLYMEKLCAHYGQDANQIRYIRYADDFVVMISGNKQLAEQIRQVIKDFLAQELQLELNLKKTLITHLLSQRARFLGYEIARNKASKHAMGNILESDQRGANETIQLLVPADVIREKLKPFVENGKAVHHKARIHLPLPDLIQKYNEEIIGLYHYYCLATDVSSKIGKFKHYHYSSLMKTVASKEKSSVAKVIRKYGVDVKRKQATGTRKIVGIAYTTPEGSHILTYFDGPIKRLDQPPDWSYPYGSALQASRDGTN